MGTPIPKSVTVSQSIKITHPN